MNQRNDSNNETGSPIDGGGTAFLNRLKPLLVHVAQISSLAGIAGFVAAIALNSVIFRTWGLTFLQIATPSDVILSGLQLAVQFLLPLVAMSLGWWIGRSLDAVPMTMIRRSIIAFVWLSLLVSYFLLRNYSAGHVGFTIHFSVVAFFFASLIAAVERVSKTTFEILHKQGFWPAFWFGAVFSYCGTVMGMQFIQITRAGVYGGAYLIKPRLESCPVRRVLWTGDRAIVARCVLSGEVRVLYQPENAEIGPVARVTDPADRQELELELRRRRPQNPAIH